MARIITTQFNRDGDDSYGRLYRVFIRSLSDSMPDAEVETLSIADVPVGDRETWANNIAKMRAWSDVRITGPTLFLDCDLIVQHSLDPLLNLGADIVLTTGGASPFNAGVLVLDKRTRRFVVKWLEVAEEMFVNEEFRTPYIRQYRGISQAALGWMLDTYRDEYQVAAVPARYWNAREGDWQYVGPNTRCVHYKSDLRRMVLGEMPEEKSYKAALKLWRSYDRP